MREPPILNPLPGITLPPGYRPVNWRRVNLIAGLLLLVLIAGCFTRMVITRFPPQEAQLIGDFHRHRQAYERLAEMFREDVGRLRTIGTPLIYRARSEISVQRSKDYYKLLNEVGGEVVRRGPKEGEMYVSTWSWGWAGCSRNIGVCWKAQAPVNVTSTLFGPRIPSEAVTPQFHYRHLEGGWYLWSDF